MAIPSSVVSPAPVISALPPLSSKSLGIHSSSRDGGLTAPLLSFGNSLSLHFSVSESCHSSSPLRARHGLSGGSWPGPPHLDFGVLLELCDHSEARQKQGRFIITSELRHKRGCHQKTMTPPPPPFASWLTRVTAASYVKKKYFIYLFGCIWCS